MIFIIIPLLLIIAVVITIIIMTTNKAPENLKSTVAPPDNVRFLNIPKAAGSAIEDAAHEVGIEWGRYHVNPENFRVTGNLSPVWHIPTKIMPENLKRYYKEKPTFVIVRNPYDRMVSEYLYHLKENGNTEPSVTGLNEMVKSIPHTPYHERAFHFVPQSDYVFDDNGNKAVTHVFKMEDGVQKALDTLSQQYSLPKMKVKKVNSTEKKLTKNDLDPESIMIINRVYKNDFPLGNYKMVI